MKCKQWKKEQARHCCTADACLCKSVNQLYSIQKLVFFLHCLIKWYILLIVIVSCLPEVQVASSHVRPITVVSLQGNPPPDASVKIGRVPIWKPCPHVALQSSHTYGPYAQFTETVFNYYLKRDSLQKMYSLTRTHDTARLSVTSISCTCSSTIICWRTCPWSGLIAGTISCTTGIRTGCPCNPRGPLTVN